MTSVFKQTSMTFDQISAAIVAARNDRNQVQLPNTIMLGKLAFAVFIKEAAAKNMLYWDNVLRCEPFGEAVIGAPEGHPQWGVKALWLYNIPEPRT